MYSSNTFSEPLFGIKIAALDSVHPTISVAPRNIVRSRGEIKIMSFPLLASALSVFLFSPHACYILLLSRKPFSPPSFNPYTILKLSMDFL